MSISDAINCNVHTRRRSSVVTVCKTSDKPDLPRHFQTYPNRTHVKCLHGDRWYNVCVCVCVFPPDAHKTLPLSRTAPSIVALSRSRARSARASSSSQTTHIQRTAILRKHYVYKPCAHTQNTHTHTLALAYEGVHYISSTLNIDCTIIAHIDCERSLMCTHRQKHTHDRRHARQGFARTYLHICACALQ